MRKELCVCAGYSRLLLYLSRRLWLSFVIISLFGPTYLLRRSDDCTLILYKTISQLVSKWRQSNKLVYVFVCRLTDLLFHQLAEWLSNWQIECCLCMHKLASWRHQRKHGRFYYGVHYVSGAHWRLMVSRHIYIYIYILSCFPLYLTSLHYTTHCIKIG